MEFVTVQDTYQPFCETFWLWTNHCLEFAVIKQHKHLEIRVINILKWFVKITILTRSLKNRQNTRERIPTKAEYLKSKLLKNPSNILFSPSWSWSWSLQTFGHMFLKVYFNRIFHKNLCTTFWLILLVEVTKIRRSKTEQIIIGWF